MSGELLQLVNQAGVDERAALVVLDENAGTFPANPFPVALAVSNRFDVCASASAAGWRCLFTDYDFGQLDRPFERVFYRLSKEKRVIEHVLQETWQQLPAGGELWLAGYKNEGVKTVAKRLAQSTESNHSLTRGDRQLHLYGFVKTGGQATPLQPDSYSELREIAQWQSAPLFSKPGIFAWDRVDTGSHYLLQHLEDFLPPDCGGLSGLDLGCGYGLLALALLQSGFERVIATDNNAAAITAATRTLAPAGEGQEVHVVAGDCGDTVQEQVDVLLCNPPFHQGFDVEQDLTDRFLAAARRLLKKQGRALFVVNVFIPLERKATGVFRVVDTIASDGRFKLVSLGN